MTAGIAQLDVPVAAVTGERDATVVPSPSDPSWFNPQHLTWPSTCSAQVFMNPAVTEALSWTPMAVVALDEPEITPPPSSPAALSPQHLIVWLAMTEHVWS